MVFTEEQKRQFDELMEEGKKRFPDCSNTILDAMITRYILTGKEDLEFDNDVENNNYYEKSKCVYNYGE